MIRTIAFSSTTLLFCLALAQFSASSVKAADTDDRGSFLASLKNVANPTTVPSNGDLNPYGVAFVLRDGGSLKKGNILVSNFNDANNQQGTGTTIVQIDKKGNQSLFFQGSGLGLTTALGVLPGNLVIVGNVPTQGTPPSPQQGSLLILSSTGSLLQTVSDPNLLNGPWDLTIQAKGNEALVFVSNVLSGTVTRLNITLKKDMPTITSMTQIGSKYFVGTDPNALVIGPTGLVFDAHKDLLYVASTGDNEIFSIAKASTTTADNGTGEVVYEDESHLHGPLALAMAPNGDLLTANGDAVTVTTSTQPNNNELVEFIPGSGGSKGTFVDELQVDTGAGGAAFGIAVSSEELAAVDDNTNMLEIFTDADKDSMGPGNMKMGGMGM